MGARRGFNAPFRGLCSATEGDLDPHATIVTPRSKTKAQSAMLCPALLPRMNMLAALGSCYADWGSLCLYIKHGQQPYQAGWRCGLRLKCRGTPRCCVVRAPSHCRCGFPAWFRAKLSAWGTTSPSQYLRIRSHFRGCATSARQSQVSWFMSEGNLTDAIFYRSS